MKAESN